MTRSPLWRGAAALAVLFGPHAVTALSAAAELAGADLGQPGLPASVNVSALSLAVAGIWLLVRARHPVNDRATRPAVGGAAALALAGAALLPLTGQAADTAATVLVAGAGAWLCAGLAADAGAPLWRGRLAGESARRWDMDAVAACAIVFAAHLIVMILDDWIDLLQGPTAVDQVDAVGLPNPTLFTIQALAAGVREEIPLLALPAALMMAARRPAWQILAVVCVLRVIPHAYLGATAPPSIIFAGAAWWMYRVTGRIGPIIVGHTLFNATALWINHAEIDYTGRRVMTAMAVALAVLLLSYAPNAAPAWLRHWLSKKPAPDDERPAKAKEPAI
ncbi:hypothetical protein ACFOY4_05050 [Actinomadura syzygii]|uniref:CPBP family intramembrane metalloprotease n=1 Tax=Actinomadura syzygii TaxID=1427538 RepID=A0A5D0TWL4_9ACTN|nr:hypothetical protein [Actinomadura syzygii]TYC10053.1 hypothetical protein FXF65_33720 [Actinomadura syzygii]